MFPANDGLNSIIHTPARRELTRLESVRLAMQSALLGPLYWTAAFASGGIGLAVHLRCMRIGLALVARKPCKRHARWIYYPLESTRYIEIDFALRQAGRFREWLDVSSPRQLAALAAKTNPDASITLLNPDPPDLAETQEIVDILALNCKTVCTTIDTFKPSSPFDLITCVSVLEHIPDHVKTFANMWQMLSPGGRLILTVPAYADGGVQLIDQDPYGLNLAVEGGYFYQRFYSIERVRELERIAGAPVVAEVWGERERGWLQANLERKRRDPLNPVWREPYDMAKNWRQFKSIGELPGEGVFCAVFAKDKA